jgi:hypothetical protein
MRKRLATPLAATPSAVRTWVDVDQTAVVEVTSEDGAHPVEAALTAIEKPGWRAAGPGAQTIRLFFDTPQRLRGILVEFEEADIKRTQEFVLRWSPDLGHSYREIVRQQWNFSPPDAVHEIEDYTVNLSGVTALELTIVPNISGGDARATLLSLRLSR